MSDTRQINQHYAEIGADLIQSEPRLIDIRNSEVRIVYLSSELEKVQNDKVVFAQCEKVPEKYKWAVPADFCIVVFEPNVTNFTERQMRILIFHELLHVGIGVGKEEMETYFVRPHDIEDFRCIIDRFGMDWNAPDGLQVEFEELKIDDATTGN